MRIGARRKHPYRMKRKILSLLFLGIGVFILVQVIMPLVSYKLWEFSEYSQNQSNLLVSPIGKNQKVPGISIEKINDNFPAIVSKNTDGTRPYKEFTITVPSIGLDRVRTVVDTNDFEQNLAHLPGSALPGEKGNVFISGHSSLPQFYRPGNFKAIFANLPKVKKGDEIIVEAGGQKFEYIVEGLKIVDPSETWVINPPDSTGRYISLMTCVPPGLYLKRLIVLGRLK